MRTQSAARGAAVLLCAAAAGGAARPLPDVRAPAGEVALRLEEVTLRRTASAALSPSGSLRAGERSAEAEIVFRLGARAPTALDRVVRGPVAAAWRAVDTHGRASGPVSARVEDGDDGPRLRLRVPGLAADVSGLARLEGALPAYAAGQRVRFHVPWLKDELPLSVDFGGGRATLTEFRLVENNSTLTVALTPPPGLRVAPAEQSPVQARALDIYGNLVNGGGIARTELARPGPSPSFTFHAPALQRTPSRLMLDVLFVAGEPAPLAVRVPPFPFPEAAKP